MINLQRHFNKISPRQCSITELWDKLGTMYNLQALDEREDLEGEDEEEEVERDFSFKRSEEFVLPLHDYDHLVTEVFREPSSPSPMRTASTTRGREGSQTPSVADSSRASSPEEDDLPRKRRTSRTTKKSDMNETSSPRTSTSSTTAASASTRRATRAKAEATPVTRGRKTVKKYFTIGNIAAFIALASKALADHVEALDPTSFDTKLAPTYEELGTAFSNKKDKVVIAKVDADAHSSLGSRFGVTGYPTIKWFPNGIQGESEPYSGGRDLDSLASFVTKKSGVQSQIKKVVSSVEVVTDATFDEKVVKSGKNVLVEFYAPWCGHCKALAPTYEQVGIDFAREKDVVIAKVDATVETATAKKYGVNGYPTIKFFSADGTTVVEYEGGRAEKDFLKFLNKKTGTRRMEGGRLHKHVGRIEQLDKLAQKWQKASSEPEKRQASEEGLKAALNIIEQDKSTTTTTTTTTTKNDGDKHADAKHYVRVFEKVAESPEFAAQEMTRLAKISESGVLSAAKADDFSVRMNVLEAFTNDDRQEEGIVEDKNDKDEL
ncbi:hypothetical protein BG004_000648 [Podila humilis]|nr:hypothetical protein BG004_000648 [Podila humilis]